MDMCWHTDDKEMRMATDEGEKIPSFLKRGNNIEMKKIKENFANLFFRFRDHSDMLFHS